jgi:hypothetical protein
VVVAEAGVRRRILLDPSGLAHGPVYSIQGGDISPSGTLYLLTNTAPNAADRALGPPYTGGIQAIVAETGVARFSVEVDFNPVIGEELEGIDFWDLETNRPVGVPPGIRGQFHSTMLTNDAFGDDYFGNFTVHHGFPASVLNEL